MSPETEIALLREREENLLKRVEALEQQNVEIRSLLAGQDRQLLMGKIGFFVLMSVGGIIGWFVVNAAAVKQWLR